MDQIDFPALISTANTLADAAREVTLRHFRADLTIDNKLDDGFDPVTQADKECEAKMRSILAELRPEDGILGEEYGHSAGTNGLTWVLDPIDGTRAYMSGAPTWGVLISVTDQNGPVLGLIDQPYIGERFIGANGQARMSGPHGEAEIKARRQSGLSAATIFTTFPEVGSADEETAFHELAKNCRLTRYGMDCYAYALLAAGQIDLVVEAGLQPYDICGPIGVIEGAGGIVTNWQGSAAHDGGRVVAASCPEIHEAALEYLSKY